MDQSILNFLHSLLPNLYMGTNFDTMFKNFLLLIFGFQGVMCWLNVVNKKKQINFYGKKRDDK